jgi:hypothetical protein
MPAACVGGEAMRENTIRRLSARRLIDDRRETQRKGEWSMTQWIRWVEFMQPWEAVQFCKAIVSSHEELDLVAWKQEERQGRLIYRADICGQEVTVWREASGQLAWDSVHYTWIAEDQIDQLHQLLKARGFTGTRTDETTPTKHVVTFQQGQERLVIRASQREYLTLRLLAVLADDFMSHYRFGTT